MLAFVSPLKNHASAFGPFAANVLLKMVLLVPSNGSVLHCSVYDVGVSTPLLVTALYWTTAPLLNPERLNRWSRSNGDRSGVVQRNRLSGKVRAAEGHARATRWVRRVPFPVPRLSMNAFSVYTPGGTPRIVNAPLLEILVPSVPLPPQLVGFMSDKSAQRRPVVRHRTDTVYPRFTLELVPLILPPFTIAVCVVG